MTGKYERVPVEARGSAERSWPRHADHLSTTTAGTVGRRDRLTATWTEREIHSSTV